MGHIASVLVGGVSVVDDLGDHDYDRVLISSQL